ncbi:EAL domain-containing protein [Moraxellaceae bacterium AER2_44_116]|nr:EAL domain-containing protein [Moraxellaceae bacterium]TQC96798.1 EAL domain-containing protein [Moraxellaceae bacterium AER2_44_116]
MGETLQTLVLDNSHNLSLSTLFESDRITLVEFDTVNSVVNIFNQLFNGYCNTLALADFLVLFNDIDTENIVTTLEHFTEYTSPSSAIVDVSRSILSDAGFHIFFQKNTENHIFLFFTDTSGLLINNEKMVYLTQHDEVTGLLNWRGFSSALSQVLATNEDDDATLVVLQINELSGLLETHGKYKTNLLLSQVALRLQAYFQGNTPLCYHDCGEFCLLRLNNSQSDMASILRESLMYLQEPYLIDTEIYFCRINIGYTLISAVSDLKFSLQKARLALNTSNNNKFQFSSFSERKNNINCHNKLIKSLESESGDLFIKLQPIFHCDGFTLTGFEIFSRFMSDDNELTAAQFIGLLRDEKDIVLFTEWMINEVILLGDKLSSLFLQYLSLHVNFSGISLVQKFWFLPRLSKLRQSLKRKNIDLVVEIDESEIFNISKPIFINFCANLDKENIKLCIDNFGEYGALKTAQEVKVHSVKIDSSFLCPDHKKNTLRHFVDYMHEANVLVYAKGIENLLEKQQWQEVGIDALQGFAIGTPLTANDLSSFLIAMP